MKQYPDRDSWLAARIAHVSSTESPALFGMSPYSTAYELGVMKQAKSDGDFAEGNRVLWGRRLQDAIAQGIADDHGVRIESLDLTYAEHPKEPRMGSSFDFQIIGYEEGVQSELQRMYSDHGPGLLEIKNVDALVYKSWPDEDLPDHFEIQVQHQLEVADRDWAVLGVLIGGNRTELYIRMRDRDVGQVLVQRISSFWFDLERGILPPVQMPEDAGIVIKLLGYAEPGAVYDGNEDKELADLCHEYCTHMDAARMAQDDAKAAKARILQRIGKAERAVLQNFSLSASMVAPTEVKAFTRSGYRNFRLSRKAHG